MTPAERQKAIAVAFAQHFLNDYGTYDILISYENWLLTEEGKRLTAPDNKLAELREEQYEESSYDLLVKISGQLDRIEGNMKLTKEL